LINKGPWRRAARQFSDRTAHSGGGFPQISRQIDVTLVAEWEGRPQQGPAHFSAHGGEGHRRQNKLLGRPFRTPFPFMASKSAHLFSGGGKNQIPWGFSGR
jgi:hypothetical protein